jgi:hypothetical protein
MYNSERKKCISVCVGSIIIEHFESTTASSSVLLILQMDKENMTLHILIVVLILFIAKSQYS